MIHATLVVLSMLVPQQPDRVRVLGVVQGSEGAPIAHATVHVLARSWATDETIGDEDRILVQADEHGRFQAQILPWLSYSAWAHRLEADGSYRVTQIVRRLLPGPAIVLPEADDWRRPCAKVTITGLDAWRERAPFRAEVVLAADPLDLTTVPVLDGAFTLPPGPSDAHRVTILDRAGIPILRAGIGIHATDLTLETPAPLHTELLVQSDDRKEPIASTEVSVVVRDHTIAIGSADAEGRASLTMSPWYELQFDARGFATTRTWCSWLEDTRKDGKSSVNLLSGTRAQGRLLFAHEPLANSSLVMASTLSPGNAEPATRGIRTRDDGAFAFQCLTEQPMAWLSLVLDTSTRARLPLELRSADPRVPLPVAFDKEQALDLADWHPIALSVHEPDGKPARGFELWLRDWEPPLPRIGDARGRMLLLLPQEHGFECGFLGERGAWTGTLQVGPRKKGEVTALDITLEPLVSVSGKVVDARGRPIRSARVEARLDQGWRQSPLERRPGILGATAERFPRSPMMLFVMSSLMSGQTLVDSSGRFALRVPRALDMVDVHVIGFRDSVTHKEVDLTADPIAEVLFEIQR